MFQNRSLKRLKIKQANKQLKNTLQIEVSNGRIITETVAVDSNAVLWSLH